MTETTSQSFPVPLRMAERVDKATVMIGLSVDSEEQPRQFEWLAEESNFIHEDLKSNAQSGFHFVTETGTGRPGGPVRNLIRSQARRNGVPKSNPRFDSDKGIPVRKRKSVLRHQKLVASQEVEITRQLQAYPKPSRGPGRSVIDPFGISGTGHSDRVHDLLNHYDSVFRHSYCPVEPREQWIPFCLSDPILLHATLFSSAISLSCLEGKISNPDIVYHHAKTIRLINSRLTNEPNRMSSDTSIAAVACLVQFENISANPIGVKIHMDGLESMVKNRGGLEALSNSPSTMRLTSWIDSAASIVLQTKARFNRDHNCGPIESATEGIQYSPTAIRYRSKLFNLSGQRSLSDETIECYHRICYLSTVKESASCYPDSKVDMALYSDMLDFVERQVVRLVQSSELRIVGRPANLAVFGLFGDAALLHIYLFLHDIPRGLPFLQMLSGRIREALEGVDLQRLELQYPEMMLWIFIMGGLGGIGTPHRAWFAKHLADACLSSGIRGGNEIAFTLSEFLWSELYLSPVTMGFWNEVAIAQGVERGYEVRRLTGGVSVATFNAPPDLK